MRKSDFHYELPARLIAQTPLPQRGASRLLRLDGETGQVEDRCFGDLPEWVGPADLLVLNDTRVMPARLFGHKATGGQVEILIERVLGPASALAFVRASKVPKPGGAIVLDGGFHIRVQGRQADLFELEFIDAPVKTVLDTVGHVPLPPYIDRPDADEDRERYQTIFARNLGAVAAPTAGLHFDEAMLDRMRGRGVELAYVTLHVGSGTFQPLRVENLNEHRMHREYCEVGSDVVERVREARERGGRVIAVGTTVVRSLETAALDGRLAPYRGDTGLFIRPGFRFHCVDAMITNFHLPESTLLTLVCAFAGYREVMDAYRHAVEQAYRFFSYGDAMFITRKPYS